MSWIVRRNFPDIFKFLNLVVVKILCNFISVRAFETIKFRNILIEANSM